MPDFTEILKIAVEQQDWSLICGLYTNITGEPLQIPDDEPEEEAEEETEEEDILSRDFSIEDLTQLNREKTVDKDDSSVYNDFTAPSKSSSSSSNSEGRRARSEPIGKTKLKNTVGVSDEGWKDDLTECVLDPETGKPFSEDESKKVRTPRGKRKELGMRDTKLINVECSVCGVEYNISPALTHGYSQRKNEN